VTILTWVLRFSTATSIHLYLFTKHNDFSGPVDDYPWDGWRKCVPPAL